MKDSEKYRKWADTIDLCDGKCAPGFRINNSEVIYRKAGSLGESGEFSFPIAIVENKPVFVGDKLWHKSGLEYIVVDVEVFEAGKSIVFSGSTTDGDYIDRYTWTKPDEYDNLREALSDGKRVAFNYNLRDSSAWVLIDSPVFNYTVDRYKIVDDDVTEKHRIYINKAFRSVVFTVCGLTGEITAKVCTHD